MAPELLPPLFWCCSATGLYSKEPLTAIPGCRLASEALSGVAGRAWHTRTLLLEAWAVGVSWAGNGAGAAAGIHLERRTRHVHCVLNIEAAV